MSSDGRSDLAYEYPTGAVPDSPVGIHPVPILDVTPTLADKRPMRVLEAESPQPLNVTAPTFIP
jgi:hypothetical protein